MDFRVRTRRDFLKAAGFCASGLAFSGCAGPDVPPPRVVAEAPPQSRPNILWVTCEDISPLLGCYGDPFAITPHLNRFAGDAVLYTNAYATAPVCSPVRSCLVTGVYATSLGTQHLRSEVPPPKEILPFPKLGLSGRTAPARCRRRSQPGRGSALPGSTEGHSPAP